MLLNPCPISSSRFLYKKGVFSAEMSELRDLKIGQVYDDACDVGFTIVSEKTGKPAVFARTSMEFREGDLISVNFKCATPGLTHLKVVLFND